MLPPFADHAMRGAAFGAFLGGSIAAVGWFVRQRDASPVDLGVPAPNLMARHRALAESLLHFKAVSEHSPTTRALYSQLVLDCEYAAERDSATGAAQVAVQKRVTQATSCAKRLVHQAYQHRDSRAHDCRMQIEALESHLGGLQKNMMM